jgi:predicted RND superfamily exporter protein
MRSVADRVARWLVDHRGRLALVAVVLAGVTVERSRNLEFSRSIDTMFDRADPALVPYRRLIRTFGASEIALAVYDDSALFTPAGITRLRELTDRLGREPGVRSTTSLATTPLGDRIVDLDASPTARRIVRLLEGYAVGADHRTAGVVCVLEPAPAAAAPRAVAVSRADTIDRLRSIMAGLPSGTVAGEPVMLRDGFAMLTRDGNLLGTASGLLAGGVLLVCFRSIRWLAVPLAVVLLALWGTRGLLAVAGLKLTMVSTMLSAMITVVAIATVTHLIIEFRRQRDAGREPEDALRETLAILFWPVVGAIATDVIGFGALVFSRVGPVHDFGLMTALGAGMVLVAVALALPWVALTGRFDTDPRRVWGEDHLARGMDGLVRRIVRHPLPILATAAVLVTAAVAGMRWLTVETDFTRNFRPTSPTVASYELVESRLGGAGVWDVLVPVGGAGRGPGRGSDDGARDDGAIDAAVLERLAGLEERLRQEVRLPGASEPALTKVMSLADLLDVAPVPLERLAGTPLGGWLLTQAIGFLRAQYPQLTGALVGRDPADGTTWLRVMLRARERQPAAAKRAIIDQVQRIVAEEYPAVDGRAGGEVTGFFVLLAQLVERMLVDQWFTFALAAVGIFLLLSIAFASPLLAAVALVPNALPIFVVLGLLGWAGEPVNMGTAMIAAVSLGLSVDSSIHYITAFRRRLRAGHAAAAALEAAHQTAGRAMVFSTLALVVGFLALTTSGFMPTVSFGWLSCLTLAGGLAGNLVVLPVLLALLTPAQGFPAAALTLQHGHDSAPETIPQRTIPGRSPR